MIEHHWRPGDEPLGFIIADTQLRAFVMASRTLAGLPHRAIEASNADEE